MSKSPSATRKDIDDVLQVLDVMMTKIDDRFNKVESKQTAAQEKIQHILNHLDKRINVKFAR